MTDVAEQWTYEFEPHAKQERALKSCAREILYGGAVYGGKSEVLLAACIDLCTLVPGAKALLVRRTTGELVELKDRLRKRVPKFVAELNKADNIYYFANGSMLILRFLDGEEDATKVQGFEVQLACFDELTHYEKSWYTEVVTRLRATGDVKRRMDELGLVPRALSASNPGGRGHSWVRDRFVKPAPQGTEFEPEGDDGGTRLFIQATLWDNPYVDHEDYIKNSLGPLDPERKRALLEGDWGIPSGTRFPQFREALHVIKPEQFPIDVVGPPRVVGVDFGFARPMASVWLAKVGDFVVAYREFVGTELSPEQQAKTILSLDEHERAHSTIVTALDPAGWRRDVNRVGPKTHSSEAPVGSIAHVYREHLPGPVVKGINDRLNGWSAIDGLLAVPEGRSTPRLLIYDTCRELINAMSSAPRDKRRPEDVDTNYAHDDVLDAFRYGVMEILGKHQAPPLTARERALRALPDTATAPLATTTF